MPPKKGKKIEKGAKGNIKLYTYLGQTRSSLQI